MDEILIKADLIEATGSFASLISLVAASILPIIRSKNWLEPSGHLEDDAKNTFTARLLLLLESSALLGQAVYTEITHEVISAYWKDYQRHKNDFSPAFLANDILRMWRTFCVNYEARTASEPDIEKAKRKLKNYKLKHSRLLTCYSALLVFAFGILEDDTRLVPPTPCTMISSDANATPGWVLSQPELAHGFTTKLDR